MPDSLDRSPDLAAANKSETTAAGPSPVTTGTGAAFEGPADVRDGDVTFEIGLVAIFALLLTGALLPFDLFDCSSQEMVKTLNAAMVSKKALVGMSMI